MRLNCISHVGQSVKQREKPESCYCREVNYFSAKQSLQNSENLPTRVCECSESRR